MSLANARTTSITMSMTIVSS